MAALDPVPDEKDWTWTLQRRCPECGLAAGDVDPADVPGRAFVAAEEWVQILGSHPAVEVRPEPRTWSPLEYAGHVRDVYRVFTERVLLMLGTDDPEFVNWDPDAAARLARDDEADPAVVADELEAAALAFVGTVQGVDAERLARTGRRSNGSVFTVATLLQYFLHDVVHHLWDVTGQQDGAASLDLDDGSHPDAG